MGLWPCSEHDRHAANLRLGHGYESAECDESDKIRFQVAVVFGDGESAAPSNAPLTLFIETQTGVADEEYKRICTRTPSVRFAEAEISLPALPGPSSLANFALEGNSCQEIRTRLAHPESESYVGQSQDRRFQSQLSCSLLPCLGAIDNAVNLSKWVAKQPVYSKVRIGEKLRIASALAVAVLQYYDTPWLPLEWKGSDILMMESKGTDAEAFQRSPHLQGFSR